MRRSVRLLALVAGVLLAVGSSAAPLHKCVVGGTVTFQQSPCAAAPGGREATLAERNAAEKKKRELASPAVSERVPTRGSAASAASAFTCDGRTHCSQMTSCAEARFFLATCTGAQMDGDRNGVPCEKQWCRAGR